MEKAFMTLNPPMSLDSSLEKTGWEGGGKGMMVGWGGGQTKGKRVRVHSSKGWAYCIRHRFFLISKHNTKLRFEDITF